MKQTLQVIEAAGSPIAPPRGLKWRVRIFEYGLSRNRYDHHGARLPLRWTPESAKAALPHLDGARCLADHAPKGRTGSVRDLIGFYSEPQMGPKGPEATLTIMEHEQWAQQKMLDAWKIGRPLAFSLDALIEARPAGPALEVSEILGINSVDLVSAASSGGAAVAVLEQAQIISDEKGSEAMSEPIVDQQVTDLEKRVEEAERKQRISESRQTLTKMLSESRLPLPVRKVVSDGLDGKECTEEEIAAKIQLVREGFAAVVPGPHRRSGVPAVEVGLEPRDKDQIALDKLYGVSHEWKQVREGKMLRWQIGPELNRDVRAFEGIREAYVAYTGDTDVSGNIENLQIREDYISTGFPSALGNTLHRRMLQGFVAPPYGLELLAPPSVRKAVPDFRDQERVRVGYFGDLSEHDPEASDWPEITAPTDEKASVAVVQFGGLVTVTRKTVINDDIGVVGQIVENLGRAARRTLARRVFNLMINNAAIYDGTTWFHATLHGANLTTNALSAAELNTIRTNMRKQAEKDSGEKIGAGPAILVVPLELEGLAKQENMREYLDSDFTPNPVRFLFGQNGERIIVSPLLTDATDFYVFADPGEAPFVELDFLGGREEPEFFLADSPTVGRAFTADRLQYKARYEFEALVTDYRGGHKAVVAG